MQDDEGGEDVGIGATDDDGNSVLNANPFLASPVTTPLKISIVGGRFNLKSNYCHII